MSVHPRAGVIGWPVDHSRSPVIHGHWLAEHGIRGSYERIPVRPEEADGFFRNFADSGLVGANVTIPHKQLAARHCDDIDDTARLLGAVNTLVLRENRLLGSNTDGIGFLGSLDAGAPGWDSGTAVVLGAGGASRAVVWALRRRGLSVRLVNRTRARADEIAGLFNEVSTHGFDEVSGLLAEASLLVNTTSLGMHGQPPLDIDLSPLPPTALVTDIVYVPLETPLLALARARGLATVDGLGMLLHQAVPGFELWFGVRPKVTPELRRLVLADMGLDTAESAP